MSIDWHTKLKHPIAFDFDGTITQENHYPNCDELRPGIVDCIHKLRDEGYPIIIHTCRDCKTHDQTEEFIMMVQYLRENCIYYDTINSNVMIPYFNNATFNSHKPYAIIYVGDDALGWNPNWTGEDIYKLIKERLK